MPRRDGGSVHPEKGTSSFQRLAAIVMKRCVEQLPTDPARRRRMIRHNRIAGQQHIVDKERTVPRGMAGSNDWQGPPG